jgi:hypothetical protein
MQMLHSNHACVPGYTRMASFFGINPKSKDIQFPIWMIGIIGQYDDITWAAGQAMEIDPVVYKEFRKKTLVQLFRSQYWDNSEQQRRRRDTLPKDKSAIEDVKDEAKKIETPEEVEAFLEKMQTQVCSNSFVQSWHEPFWCVPSAYIARVLSTLTTRIGAGYLNYLTDLESTKLAGTPKKRAVKKISERPVRSREEAEEVEEDEEDTWTAPKKTPAALFYFTRNRPNETVQEYFASLFLPAGVSPFEAILQFMMTSKMMDRSKAPFDLVQVNGQDDKPPQFLASLSITKPETIFRIYHLLNGKNLDINKLLGINALGAALQSSASHSSRRVRNNSGEDVHASMDILASQPLEQRMAIVESVSSTLTTEVVSHNEDDDSDENEDL